MLNEEARSHWLGRDNVGYATIEGNQMLVLLDTWANVNMITPKCVMALGLQMGPLTDLCEGGITIDQPFNYEGWPTGYVIIRVQINRISSYDEDQVMLIAQSSAECVHKVLIILGTPTTNRAIATLKESKIDELATLWACVRKSTLLQAVAAWVSAIRADVTTKPVDIMGFKEPVHLLTPEVVEPFETLVVRARTKTTFTVGQLWCSTLTMDLRDGTLPPRLVVTSAYMVLRQGSKTVPMVLHNMTGSPIHLRKGQKVAQVQASNEVPHPQLKLGTLESLEESENPKPTLSVEEHQKKLLASLDLSGLDKWPTEKAEHACELLREYHDVFSLKDNKLGCTSQVKHSIKVTNDEPFKEWFRHIPPPLLEEVRTHVNDMLQAGAIQPSISPLCNAVILIWKKDGGHHFCIDFRKLNVRTKKDSYPLPCIQETLESLEGSCIFSSFDLKLGFWQVEMDEVSKQYTTFMVGSLGFFECEHIPFGLCNVPMTFQWLIQDCLGELNLTYCLIYLDDVITFSKDNDDHLHCMRVIFDMF